MNTWRETAVRWRQIGLILGIGASLTILTLFILSRQAHAAVFGSGAGGCGDFATAVDLAQDGDAIIQMITAKDSSGAVISKNLRISGGWAPNPSCDEANQTFTETTDVADFGFLYVAPTTRSELNYGAAPVLTINDESAPNFPQVDNLVLENLILANLGTVPNGGGINGVISGSATVLLDNLMLVDNFVTQDGGGISLTVRGGSHLIIEDSVFTNNHADEDGGGLNVEARGSSRLTIRNTRFDDSDGADNEAENGGGFEIRVYDDSQVLIENSEIANNRTTLISGVGGGGRIVIEGGSVIIKNTVFQNNDGGDRGGGLFVEMNEGELQLFHTTFTGNQADNGGAGLYVDSVGSNPATVMLVDTSFDNASDYATSGPVDKTILDTAVNLPAVFKEPSPYQARITGITIDNNLTYLVAYEVSGFVPDTSNLHVHFFFDTVDPQDAGVPGAGPWILYDGPSPFTGYSFGDRPFGPDGAEKMCILVANGSHEVFQNTGNCVELP